MKTIWKYTLELTEQITIKMPGFAEVLDVQMQSGKPCMWAEVEDNASMVTRTFGIFGTGHPLPSNPKKYIATFQIHGAGMVFHLYEFL